MFAKLRQKIAKKNPATAPALGEHPMFRPARDWSVALVTFAVLVLGVALLGGYMFLQVKQGVFFESAPSEAGGAPVRLDHSKLENVIGFYEQKASRYREFSSEAPNTFDPLR